MPKRAVEEYSSDDGFVADAAPRSKKSKAVASRSNAGSAAGPLNKTWDVSFSAVCCLWRLSLLVAGLLVLVLGCLRVLS